MKSEFEIVAGELHAKLVVGSHSWASGQRTAQHQLRRPHRCGGAGEIEKPSYGTRGPRHSWAAGPGWTTSRSADRRSRRGRLAGRPRRSPAPRPDPVPESPRLQKQQPAPHSNTQCPMTQLLQHNENQKEAARGSSVSGRFRYVCCGGVLLSHNLAVAVPLALPGLASRFGMGAGRFPGAMTTTSFGVQHAPPCFGLFGGCGLIVVCIVVAAVLPWFLLTRTCCLGVV